MEYLAHEHPRREDGGVTTRHHIVAQLEVGMAWNLLQVGIFRCPTLPAQITEIATVLYLATDVRLHVEHRYHHAITLRHEIDDAHDTRAAHYAHVLVDAIGTTLVERDEIVGVIDAVAHHLGRYQAIILKKTDLIALHPGAVLGDIGETLRELLHLLF